MCVTSSLEHRMEVLADIREQAFQDRRPENLSELDQQLAEIEDASTDSQSDSLTRRIQLATSLITARSAIQYWQEDQFTVSQKPWSLFCELFENWEDFSDNEDVIAALHSRDLTDYVLDLHAASLRNPDTDTSTVVGTVGPLYEARGVPRDLVARFVNVAKNLTTGTPQDNHKDVFDSVDMQTRPSPTDLRALKSLTILEVADRFVQYNPKELREAIHYLTKNLGMTLSLRASPAHVYIQHSLHAGVFEPGELPCFYTECCFDHSDSAVWQPGGDMAFQAEHWNRIYRSEFDSARAIVRNLRFARRAAGQKFASAIIGSHGSSLGMLLNDTERIDGSFIRQHAAAIKFVFDSCLEPTAMVHIGSCRSGEVNGVAHSLAIATNRTITGSTEDTAVLPVINKGEPVYVEYSHGGIQWFPDGTSAPYNF